MLSRFAPLSLRLFPLLALACDGMTVATRGDVSGGQGIVITRDGGQAGGGVGDPDGGAGSGAGGQAGGVSAQRAAIIAACEACEASKCSLTSPTVSDDYGSAVSGQDYYAYCHGMNGNATTGPAKGTPLAQLCQAVLDCAHETSCAVTADGKAEANGREKNLDCYCGADVSPGECMVPGKAHGPCKDAIEEAAGTNDPGKITANYVNPIFATDDPMAPKLVNAAGAALGLIYFCEADQFNQPPSVCTQDCLQPPDGDGGAPDAIGGSTAGADGAAGGGGGPAGRGGSGGAGGAGCASGSMTAALCGNAHDDDCERCELAADPSVVPTCDPAFLTANSGVVDGTGSSWGFGTLATEAQQAAARDLFAAILASIKPGSPTGCASNTTNTGPGDHPEIGCLGGPGVTSAAILGGAISGPLASLYKAAALADDLMAPSGDALTATSSDHDFAGAIAGVTSKPTTAIGLADNLFRCAFFLDQDPGTACLAFDQSAGLTGPCAGASGVATCASDADAATSPVTCSGAAGAGAAGAGDPEGSGAGGSLGSDGGAGTGNGGAGAGSGGNGGATATAGAGGGGSAGNASTCPDLDADGVPDCQQTIVANPSFSSVIAPWAAEIGATASWTSRDANGSAISGALAVTNVDTNVTHASNGSVTAGAYQCISVAAGSSYEVAAHAFLPSGQGAGWAGFVLEEYFAAGCAGAPWPVPFVSPQVTATGSWQTVSATTTQIPLGIVSVGVRLVAGKPAAQASLEALFDDVLVRVK